MEHYRKVLLLLATILVIQNAAMCQRIISGKCPKRRVVSQFELDKYLGLWYEISRYEHLDYTPDCDCITLRYTKDDNGSIFVRNCCMIKGNTTEYCAQGIAMLSRPNENPIKGKLNVEFGTQVTEPNYSILATDYYNYALVYHCQKISRREAVESAWILARERRPVASVQAKINELIDNYLDPVYLYTQNPNECYS